MDILFHHKRRTKYFSEFTEKEQQEIMNIFPYLFEEYEPTEEEIEEMNNILDNIDESIEKINNIEDDNN